MAITRKITNSQELHDAMNELERKIQVQELQLKENYGQVKDNLQPKRVVKNTFSYLAETPEIQKTLVNTVIGFIIGYASKRAVEVLSEQALDRTVHNMVNHQISKIENKNPESVVSKAISLFRKHTPHDSPIYPFVRYK
jgi:predicted nuclease with TOPRIM domain